MATWEKIEDIEVWREARKLSQKTWDLIQNTSLQKDYKLRDQMSSSSGSIMDNIAEGFGRDGNKEFKQFLSFAVGSCTELRSQLYRSLDRKHIDQSTFDVINNEVLVLTRRIKTLMNYLKDSPYKGNKFKEPLEEYIAIHESQNPKLGTTNRKLLNQ